MRFFGLRPQNDEELLPTKLLKKVPKDDKKATPGFEPGVKALQASALPLGHVAVCSSIIKKT